MIKLSTGSSSFMRNAIAERRNRFALPLQRGNDCLLGASTMKCGAHCVPFDVASARATGLDEVLVRRSSCTLSNVAIATRGMPMRVGTRGAICGLSTAVSNARNGLCSTLERVPNIRVRDGNGVLLSKRKNVGMLVGKGAACLDKRALVGCLQDVPTSAIRGVRLVGGPSSRLSTTKGAKIVGVRVGEVGVGKLVANKGTNCGRTCVCNSNCNGVCLGLHGGGFGLCASCTCCRKVSLGRAAVSHRCVSLAARRVLSFRVKRRTCHACTCGSRGFEVTTSCRLAPRAGLGNCLGKD